MGTTLRRWESSWNRRKGTSRNYHNSWETLEMQEKGHGVTITVAQGRQEEDRFM